MGFAWSVVVLHDWSPSCSCCCCLCPRAHPDVDGMLLFMCFDINQHSLPQPLLFCSWCLFLSLRMFLLYFVPWMLPTTLRFFLTLFSRSYCCLISHFSFSSKSSYFFHLEIGFFLLYGSRLAAREVSWLVVCAACCPVALVFAVMHLYDLQKCYCFCPFLVYTLENSGIDKSTEGSTITAYSSLMCFLLTEAIPKGLILRKFHVWRLCMYVVFYINLCQDWFCRF